MLPAHDQSPLGTCFWRLQLRVDAVGAEALERRQHARRDGEGMANQPAGHDGAGPPPTAPAVYENAATAGELAIDVVEDRHHFLWGGCAEIGNRIARDGEASPLPLLLIGTEGPALMVRLIAFHQAQDMLYPKPAKLVELPRSNQGIGITRICPSEQSTLSIHPISAPEKNELPL